MSRRWTIRISGRPWSTRSPVKLTDQGASFLSLQRPSTWFQREYCGKVVLWYDTHRAGFFVELQKHFLESCKHCCSGKYQPIGMGTLFQRNTVPLVPGMVLRAGLIKGVRVTDHGEAKALAVLDSKRFPRILMLIFSEAHGLLRLNENAGRAAARVRQGATAAETLPWRAHGPDLQRGPNLHVPMLQPVPDFRPVSLLSYICLF